jgi:YD repeat-containing protein
MDRKGNQTQYADSAAGDLTEENDPLGHRVSCGFDSLGCMNTLTDGPATDMAYTHDELNRLTNVRYNDGREVSYTYDAAGNILSAEVVP